MMRHPIPKVLLTLAVLTGLTLGGPVTSAWSANMSTDYTGTPPYLSNVVAPNILLLMDNSVSMQARANCDPAACVSKPDGRVNNDKEVNDVFVPATVYAGYFNSMHCYTYGIKKSNDTTDPNNRFADGGAKGPPLPGLPAVTGLCGLEGWDGNLLNWITFRRVDAIKKAMTGGECSGWARNDVANDGTCPVGADGKITIQSNRSGGLISEVMILTTTNPVGDQITGRVPKDYRYADGLWIHLRGSGVYGGWFCVNDNQDGWYGWYDAMVACDAGYVVTCVNCNHEVRAGGTEIVAAHSDWVCDVDGELGCLEGHFVPVAEYTRILPAVDYYYDSMELLPGVDATAAGFNIKLALDTQPKGVIQQVGSQARLGLMVFQPGPDPDYPEIKIDGGIVTVGIGARQSTVHVAPRTTNTAAIIDGIDAIYPQSATPLAESLYEAARYIAQLPPSQGTVVSQSLGFDASSYSYPLAFAGDAVGFGKTGVGSIGKGELSALIKGETCPTQDASGKPIQPAYIDNACGRDPYFFGQNHTPGWASPSAVVPCCKTFVILVTDGAPHRDANIPDGLKEYAAGVQGTQCPTYAGGPCTTNLNTSPSDFLLQHRTDYPGGSHYLDDVALWAHTTDLRQDTIPGLDEKGHDLPGKTQNLTLYTVYAFGNVNGREILMQAARQGGYEYDFDKPKKLSELATQVCTNPDGSTGTSSPEWDQQNNLTGKYGPDCIPDNYFESNNADEIRDRLFAAINKIFESSSSSAAVSVLASSSTGEGISYQAFFYQTKTAETGVSSQLTWLGYLQGFFVDTFGNLREDTIPLGKTADHKLVLTEDYIIKLRYDSGLGKTVADRYRDKDGTGMGEKLPFEKNVDLSKLQPVWEAGRQLALTDAGQNCAPNTGGVSCRRILTWLDRNNDGIVDPAERIEFTNANMTSLCPYLGGRAVAKDPSACAGADGQTEAQNIIDFIRGCDPVTCPGQTGLRDRSRIVDGLTKIWKLGDIMASTPVVLGAPPERYDVIYGDIDYATFYHRYKDRRQVVYAGANDGMLHAFNGGFLSVGLAKDKERLRFLTSPREPASDVPCPKLPCDDPDYAVRGNDPSLGAELWAFVPHDLLPQLRWLTEPNYSHTYYVDLKPKVTDVRIFTPDADHPGGWGTILIGGSRFGGSCSNCTQGKGGARTVTADFGGGPTTRVFLSSYFVLDITNPEKDPVLLWTFRDEDLGLTTALPAVIRVNPKVSGQKLSDKDPSDKEKWYAVFGTGMTHYDGSSGQTAQIFVVDLKLGPTYSAMNQTSGTARAGTLLERTCTTDSPCVASNTATNVGLFSTAKTGFMGDAVSLDVDLDFRVDVIYIGSTFCNKKLSTDSDGPCQSKAGGPVWKGAMWRISTYGGDTDLTAWGVSGAPTQLISTFTPSAVGCQNSKLNKACSTVVGPIVAAPTITIDKGDSFWIFFGTGRLIDNLDKPNADPQNFFGVKDCTITSSCPALPDGSLPDETVERHYLMDVSRAKICTSQCVDPEKTVSRDGTSFTEGTDTFISDIQTRDGWVTTLLAGERSLSKAALLGGTLFFSTFSPDDSLCNFSGLGRLYGLYYLTGTGFNASTLGAQTADGKSGAAAEGKGPLMANSYVELGSGLPSQVALQIGSLGEGLAGVATAGRGCVGGVTTNMQMSNATIGQVCTGTGPAYSRVIAWRDL